jgi:ATP-binding cassette subfamily B protein
MIYLSWIAFFLKKRKDLDLEKFEFSSNNQSILVQILNGIHDLKINNAEDEYFNKWKEN